MVKKSLLNTKTAIVFLLLLTTLGASAQPRYSPQVRSAREIKWMQDSLRINQKQVNEISGISLKYQQDMDMVANEPGKTKKQAVLMKKKDKEMKSILDDQQYRKYISREEMIRKRDAIVYKDHQPL